MNQCFRRVETDVDAPMAGTRRRASTAPAARGRAGA